VAKMLSRPKMGTLRRREELEGYLYASPWLVGFTVFTLGPIIASLVFSFCKYDVVTPMEWIGFRNYGELVHDPLFWKALYNTVYYTMFSVPLNIIVGLALAMFLNQELPGVSLIRTLYYVPAVLSGVAVSMLWVWLLDPSIGLINYLLEKIGLPGPLWLSDPKWSKPALILMSLWGVGGSMVIYLAGLQGIPQSLYDAAEIDGATGLGRIRYITIPLMTPIILFQLIMGVIGSFQVFTQSYVMTGGGPLNSTLFYVLYLYKQAFSFFRMGVASAMAWILLITVLVLTLLILRSSGSWVYYESDVRR
jgi:multiple sugar transport system permease protein